MQLTLSQDDQANLAADGSFDPIIRFINEDSGNFDEYRLSQVTDIYHDADSLATAVNCLVTLVDGQEYAFNFTDDSEDQSTGSYLLEWQDGQ